MLRTLRAPICAAAQRATRRVLVTPLGTPNPEGVAIYTGNCTNTAYRMCETGHPVIFVPPDRSKALTKMRLREEHHNEPHLSPSCLQLPGLPPIVCSSFEKDNVVGALVVSHYHPFLTPHLLLLSRCWVTTVGDESSSLVGSSEMHQLGQHDLMLDFPVH